MGTLQTSSNRSPTRFSANTFAVVEKWKTDLDADRFYLPTVPPDDGPALWTAHREISDALQPASPEQVEHEMMQLRTRSHRRNETAQETEAAFRPLCQALAGIPIDLLRRGLLAYSRSEKFFPRSAAEVLPYVGHLVAQRKSIAYRLRKLAEEADRARDETARMAHVEEIPISEIRSWPPSYRQTALNKGWITQDQLDIAEDRKPAFTPLDNPPEPRNLEKFTSGDSNLFGEQA